MQKFNLSKRKIEAISNGTFLFCLGILFATNEWWPGILLALWASLGLRQFLSGRTYDFLLTTLILVGLFIVSLFQLEWSVIMPVLFIVGGIYIIFREYFFADDTDRHDKSQDLIDDNDRKSR